MLILFAHWSSNIVNMSITTRADIYPYMIQFWHLYSIRKRIFRINTTPTQLEILWRSVLGLRRWSLCAHRSFQKIPSYHTWSSQGNLQLPFGLQTVDAPSTSLSTICTPADGRVVLLHIFPQHIFALLVFLWDFDLTTFGKIITQCIVVRQCIWNIYSLTLDHHL
jgi:hypothetical protein